MKPCENWITVTCRGRFAEECAEHGDVPHGLCCSCGRIFLSDHLAVGPEVNTTGDENHYCETCAPEEAGDEEVAV